MSAASGSRRLIAYSLFGTDRIYRRGALANAELAGELFPGWTCRIYISQEVPAKLAERLTAAGADVVRQERHHAFDALFWRFLPAGEPEVDAVIVRDVDARLTPRGKSAVDDWLASGKSLHIIRDHPQHKRLIPAGLWGVRGGALSGIEERIAAFGKTAGFDHRTVDGEFLERCVYADFVEDHFLHSSFVYFTGEQPHQIPVARTGSHYLGYPPGRGLLSIRRRIAVARAEGRPLVEHPLPEWVRE